MSANNIVIIKKEGDGKFRGYHRDYDVHCEGRYDRMQTCPKCCGEGSVEISPVGVVPCGFCMGSGGVKQKETPIFEADTIEGAIHAYNKWFREMSEGFSFTVEYGYEFEGLEPNEETIETFEKSKRGEELHAFGSVEELVEDLENATDEAIVKELKKQPGMDE